ncbi:MAG: AcrB/AcrD/AcrF family protein, partial [Deltaproteobacteria bacterium]|nr:AcrB/AcrD/AcrF family protein [Deltaproteobacteria bacterium]
MMTVGLLQGGFIHSTFFPIIDGDTLPINLSLVAGRQEEDTNRILVDIEKICWQVNEQIKIQRPDGRDVIEGIKRVIGNNDFDERGSHAGKLKLQLLEGEQRDMDTHEIAKLLRDATGPVHEAQNLTFGRVSMFGKAISVSLLGTELEELRKARDLLMVELDNFSALSDVVDSEQEGRREI